MNDERENLSDDIRKIEELKASRAMPADLADRLMAELRQKQAFHAKLDGDGALAQGEHAKAVGRGGILVEGIFQGNIYMGADPAEDEKRLAIYCRWVVQSTASLPLRGVDVGASDPTDPQKSIGLANVYIDLDTTASVDYQRVMDVTIKGEQIRTVVDDTKAVSVLSSVLENRQLILLGEPGGGKSTFVNFLAHCLSANALEPEKGWLSHLNDWPQDESHSLPLIVILRDFVRSHAEKLPAKAEPQHLMNFIKARLEAQNLGFALPLLEKALDEGQAIVLLDGLDEVPTQAQRVFVRDAVHAFINRYPKSRFLVTCRVLSYQPPATGKADLRLNELPTFEIAPFDIEKIDRFVTAWYAELGRLGSVPGEDVPVLTTRLREAVRRPDLQRLAPNPLLLTVMSLVHTHRGRLPDARALLYEETIDILLSRWEQIKLGGQDNMSSLRRYLDEAGRTDVDLKRVLWQLAYEAHAQAKPDDSGESLADLSEHRILKALAALKTDDAHPSGDLNWAKNLVELMKVRAGLLLERQPEIFTFPHRTFQEYLAGAHLAAQANFSELVSELAHRNMTLWRESILYAAGKLVYVNGDVAKPLALVAELCPDETQDGQTPWRLAWLAGDVLRETGLKRVRDSVFGRDLLKRNQLRLKDLLETGRLAPRERTRVGHTLATLGDPRFDPERWFLPADENLGFIHIPAGNFIMGSNENNDEMPQHKLNLLDYWIGKYPVTVAQFATFVQEQGYKPDGGEKSIKGPSNHPVTYVTWYDALQYCRWINQKLQNTSQLILNTEDPTSLNNDNKMWQYLISQQITVSIPSEAEWEKASRGLLGQKYTWDGEYYDIGKANVKAANIGATTTVGCFPDGKSPFGIFDMSGNVKEWTRSLWGLDYLQPDFKYPYIPYDEYEKFTYSPAIYRVIRGSDFDSRIEEIRCSFRDRQGNTNSVERFGFRLVLTPFFLDKGLSNTT